MVERVEDQKYAFVRHVRLVNETTIREILSGVTSNVVKLCAVPVIENGHVLESEISEIIVNTEARRGEKL